MGLNSQSQYSLMRCYCIRLVLVAHQTAVLLAWAEIATCINSILLGLLFISVYAIVTHKSFQMIKRQTYDLENVGQGRVRIRFRKYEIHNDLIPWQISISIKVVRKHFSLTLTVLKIFTFQNHLP